MALFQNTNVYVANFYELDKNWCESVSVQKSVCFLSWAVFNWMLSHTLLSVTILSIFFQSFFFTNSHNYPFFLSWEKPVCLFTNLNFISLVISNRLRKCPATGVRGLINCEHVHRCVHERHNERIRSIVMEEDTGCLIILIT